MLNWASSASAPGHSLSGSPRVADCASGSFHGNSPFFSVAAPSVCKKLVEPQELLAASFYFETSQSPAGCESKTKGCEIKAPVQRARAARHSETRHGNCAGEKSSRAGLGPLTTHTPCTPESASAWGQARVATGQRREPRGQRCLRPGP